jgi:hypothetical protein
MDAQYPSRARHRKYKRSVYASRTSNIGCHILEKIGRRLKDCCRAKRARLSIDKSGWLGYPLTAQTVFALDKPAYAWYLRATFYPSTSPLRCMLRGTHQ